MSEFSKMAPQDQARLLGAFIGSPVWQELIKPSLMKEINALTKSMIYGNDPDKDRETKAQIKAYGWLLNWESSYEQVIGKLRGNLASEQVLESQPVGSPY